MIIMMIGISSCATANKASAKATGTMRAVELGSTMQLVEDDLTLLLVHVKEVNSSLQLLIQPGQVALAETYKQFRAAVEPTKKTAERFYSNSDLRNEQSNMYFDGWRTQGNTYSDSKVQALSEARRVEMMAVNASIAAANVGVKGALKNYLETINEINSYFSTDLTPKGVDAIRSVAQAVIDDGVILSVAIEKLCAANTMFHNELLTGDAK
jgi:hypothetical protein